MAANADGESTKPRELKSEQRAAEGRACVRDNYLAEVLAGLRGLRTLRDTPSWDWPRDPGKKFQEIPIDPRADASDRLVAAELAGDLTVMNDELADS